MESSFAQRTCRVGVPLAPASSSFLGLLYRCIFRIVLCSIMLQPDPKTIPNPGVFQTSLHSLTSTMLGLSSDSLLTPSNRIVSKISCWRTTKRERDFFQFGRETHCRQHARHPRPQQHSEQTKDPSRPPRHSHQDTKP